MTGPLGYLAARSVRNRLARQIRRLRTPRYAVALLLGLAYLWAVGVHQRPSSSRADISPRTVELLAAIGVLVVVLWTWLFGADRRALAFSRAEVTFLFPAPLTRRALIQYKLLRGQFLILFNVLLWTFLLSGGWDATGPWRRAGAIWVLLTVLALHRLGVALLRNSLLEHGRAAIRARAATLALVILVGAVVAVDAARAMPALQAAWDIGLEAFLAAAAEVAARPVPNALLFPFRLLARPMLAESWGDWLCSMLPALGLLAVHYVWVMHSDAAFEESAAAAALTRRHSGRRGASASGFVARRIPPLAPTGWPAGALLWKNLAAVVRTGRARTTLIGFAAAALVIAWLSIGGNSATLLEIVGWLAAMWAGLFLILGPQWVRNDLRTDLSRLGVLRSYPLRGRTVVAAEAAGSTAVLTAVELGLLGIAYLAFRGGEVIEPPAQLRTAVLVAAVVFLPAINFLAMLIQKGVALVLPGWVRVGPDRPIGVEALGHNMLMMLGFVAVLAALLVVPAAAATGIFLELEPFAGWWAAVPAAAAALAVATVEARLLLSRLGRVFEATDPSSVPAVEWL
jgi:ABC-2 type transport system permease protein